MRKAYISIIIIIAIIIFVSCSDSNVPANYKASLSGYSLNIGDDHFTFSSNGGVVNTAVKTYNTSWQFSSVPSWLAISPKTGNAASAITITASENFSADTARASLFYLESTEPNWQYKLPVHVTQESATPFLAPSSDSLIFTGSEGSRTVDVKSNIEWSVSSSASWLKAEKGQDNTSLFLTVGINSTDVSRTAVVTLSGGRMTSAIQIIQQAAGVTGSTETLEFDNQASSKFISITADAPWNAKTSSSWITVTPDSGDAGSFSLGITVTENTSVNSRTGYVYVNMNQSTKLQIPIHQKGLYVELDNDVLSFSADSETLTLGINSNMEWDVLSYPEWLSISPLHGLYNQTISVTSQKNLNAVSRNGVIKIGKESIPVSKSINVRQDGMTLSANTDQLQFSNTASSQDVIVTTIAEWTAITQETWIHLSQTTGTGNSTISVSVDENKGEGNRIGSIMLTSGELTYTISIVQQGIYFEIKTTLESFGSHGGTLQLSFSTNEQWTATVSDNASWLSISPTQGTGDGIITITASDNASMSAREGMIIISPQNSQQVRIPVKQEGLYLNVSPDHISLFKTGGESEIVTVSTNGTYTIKNNASWLTVDKKDNNHFVVRAEPNDDIGRYSIILITMTGLNNNESYYKEISIQQFGNDLTGYINGHAYVDLGLPSGTLWAQANVGANTPTDTGGYFQWGGVKGGDEGNPCRNLKSSIQGSKNDAATKLWGSGWCIPTISQANELFKWGYTKIESATINGVVGYKIISKINGNTLFFPSAGYNFADGTFIGRTMVYWTCEPNLYFSDSYTEAKYFNAAGVDGTSTGMGKSCMLPIRAVINW